MTIQEILKSSNKVIKENIKLLADDYKNISNRNVCKSCPSDVQSMLNYLKNHYKVVNFQLKKPMVIYKLEKGSSTISNQNMTDELAIQFLKINKQRIELFSVYPENYLELIGEDVQEEKSKKTSLKKPCKNCKKKTITKRKSNGSK